MGSEVFNLKSFYLEDTVVRGARISSKNARTTRTIEVNPGDEPTVKTGETGVNREYLIQSSLYGNDLSGYGTFTNNSDVIRNYTGAQNLEHNDKIRLNGEKIFYTITGIEGTDVHLVERYQKENITDPDVSSGVCDIKKVKLDSAKYEYSNQNITYDKDNSEWGVTGIQMSEPVIAPSDIFEFDTGMNLRFKSGVLNNEPDIATVQSEYKTLIDNNTSPIYDVSLSPIPFPHESLQVYIGKYGEVPQKAIEYEDYAINYSSNPELKYPIPPFEERDVAYIKFLGFMVDEEQVNEINSDYEGRFTIVKEEQEESVIVKKPLQEIIPTDDFSIKVGGIEKENNFDYIIDNEAGIVNTVSHNNSEFLIDTITVQKKLIWDGISVIKGVRQSEVINMNDLVIPPVEGLNGINYPVYFEDTDINNLLRDTNFIIDPESGAFTLTSPLKEDESVLISFYVEGNDIENEKVDLYTSRLKSFPIIVDSLILNQKYTEINDEGNEITKNRIMVEGIDFTISYITGYLNIINLSQTSKEIIASYTPMTQINCVVQSILGDDINFRYTIINDVLTFEQDNEGSKQLKFKVNNPVISVPKKILFDKDKTEGNYNFTSTILPENILKLKTVTDSKVFDIEGVSYDDLTKIITLDESVNKITPIEGEIVVGTYSYESDVLPYAPVLLLYTIINAGDNSFDIEGYDKTDILKSGAVFRIDNSDPESTNYFLIKNVSYVNEKTTVKIYGTFPEYVRDPNFYLFDDQVNWNDLTSDVIVDTTVPIGSEQIIFTGNLLSVNNNININTLLLVNNQEIYSVTGLTISGEEAVIEIYPALRSSLTSNIKFSRLPIYNEGDTDLNAKQFILDDPEQPAFTLWYEPPTGFVGSAKMIFLENIITIEETISGVKNTESYVFNTDDYSDIYTLAKAIQSTPSTYNLNVLNSGVPNYYPFTISHNNKEQYYLGGGVWSPESMISFEEEAFVSLPYTFTITPELYKWSLLELYKNLNEFTVYNKNCTSFFKQGMILYFYNRINERSFFTLVKRSYLSNEINTKVELTSLITENMINPVLNVYYDPEWKNLYNELLSIDYDNNILTISGKPAQDLKINSLLYVGFEYVFQINIITEFSEYFTIKLNSNIPSEMAVQRYTGYVKYSSKPVSLTEPDDQWIYVGNLNEEKLEVDTDYTIDNGSIALTNSIESKDRFRINYMGLNTLIENEGDSITCTCRFLSYLPEGYRIDVYLDYLNIDQFYFQKLTERKFGEIVLTPQIEELLDQIGSGGQGAGSGATNDSVPNYEGGLVNLEYALQDENIKKQLYLRIYHWYKQRLRSLSAELQLGMGLKFAHSTHIGEAGNYYSIEDAYVEGNDYFLTTDEDINQIENGFSKFFPIGYNGQAPAYYNQFGTDYLSFNEVYGCNIRYKDNEGNIVTKGIIKSDHPYWNKTSDLIFQIWSEDSIAGNNNLVGHYYVDVPEKDRVLPPSEFSFLKVIEIGDHIKLDNFKNYYMISEIVSSERKEYEYIVTDTIINNKGIDYFDLVSLGKSFEEFMDVLPSDGMRMWIRRQAKEDFPMSDSYGTLGATAYGDKPKGHVINTRRIKKRFAINLFNFLFPFPFDTEPTKIFSIYVKKDSEEPWEKIGDIDLSKLTFKEERNIDDVMDGLRYDFEEKFSLPTYTWYDITQDDNKGFHRYFYLSFEKIYDANEDQGYYEGIVIRAKNRNWWFKILDSGDRPIVDDLGYIQDIEYKNFYDPENIYKKMLIEKQAWETEELIIRDLYDFNDKIARAFYQGNMNVVNSLFRDYLAKPDGGTVDGISDILKVRIPAYEKQLRFLIDPVGPVYRVLYPDLIHAEDSASPEIAITYNQTQQALSIYTTSYYRMLFYNTLNSDNNEDWKNNYVRWALSLERGIIYQSIAKNMFEQNAQVLIIGLEEISAMNIKFSNQETYTVNNSYVNISSTYYGKYINILFSLIKNNTQTTIPSQSITFFLYTEEEIGEIKNIVNKTINQIVYEISNYEYGGIKIFTASNIFDHYENNITPNFIDITNEPLTSSGIIINCSNVADHRSSDPRILYINRQIEDRVYTHEVRSVPGFNLEYIGNFYDLEYSQVAFKLSQINDDDYYIDYQCFIDERNKKSIKIWANRYSDPLVLTLYYLDNNGGFLRYKTFNEFVAEINNVNTGIFNNLHAELIYSNGLLSCELIKENDYYVYGIHNSYVDVYFTLINVENDIAYYRITTSDSGNRKLNILFYELVKDGSTYRRTDNVEKIFEFNFNKSDGSYKTLEEICTELSEYNYRGDLLFSANSVYTPEPKEGLLTSYVVLNDEYVPIDQNLGSKIYVDTYIETLGNTEYNSRNIYELKNAVFSFPMYTANGNPNKFAIEDIPVSGGWEETEDKNVIELECIDGDSWEVTFSDISDEDYKSYMAPQEIINLINEGQTLTQEQYSQIQIIEDRPAVPVIKELVLIRKSGTIRNEFHVNLRQYNTLFTLVDAISKATFNDDGDYDINGNRKFFNATLIGSSEVEGEYKSYELDSYYNPVIKSFSVEDPKPGYPDNISYKNNHVIGWEMATEELEINEIYNLRMSGKRYSHGPNYQFTMNPPEQAYVDTLYNNPQGFRRDILAFDIYSWDVNAQYEIRDNWIYFKSASVNYSFATDLGQPDKNIGYGIPLAGSGHISAPYNESLSDLINRINSNTVVNKWFYANIRFTRDDKVNPGYFEYNYLPNFLSSVPKSSLDPIMLRNDNVMNIRPGEGYSFTSSNITIDYSTKTMDLSCNWRYPYTYEVSLFFNESGNTILGDLETSINNQLPSYFSVSLAEANVLPTFSSTLSSSLIPTLVDKPLTTSYTDIKVNTGSGQVSAFQVKLRAASGSFFEITNAKFRIPISRDRITFLCTINYFNSYSISSYDLSTKTMGELYQFLSGVTDPSYPLFGSLFRLQVYSDVYETMNAGRLLDTNNSINVEGVELYAYLRDVIGIKLLNMYNAGTVNISSSDITVTTFKTYNINLPSDKDVHDWIDENKGNFTEGFLSCDVLPIKITAIDRGNLAVADYILTTNNQPAHVYFGVMGDIKFVQISDYNLHTQYNYIKDRLGKPWKNAQGDIIYDYYTPENYNENNPYAIDFDNFLGYLRTTRYNQIKNSVINESLIQNKYFWLYMKFHKEFGCDQRVITLQNQIEKREEDVDRLNGAL